MAASGVSLVAGKTQNWGFVETKTLICLWAEEDIQRQLASMGRKKNIWEGKAMKLQESGYSRSGDQCKTRMHNLQQKYKKVKTLNNTSGQGKNSFPFYEEIDKVLGHKPSINPLSTLSSVAGGSSSSSDNTLDALETESVLSSVDGLDEENFLCEDVTAEDVSVNVSEDDDAPTPLTSQKKSEPEQKSKNKADKKRKQPKSTSADRKRKQPKSTSADKMESFMGKFFEIQQESERRFLESEERRSKQEAEQEEKRRRFEAEQDEKRENFLLRVLQTIAQGTGGSKD